MPKNKNVLVLFVALVALFVTAVVALPSYSQDISTSSLRPRLVKEQAGTASEANTHHTASDALPASNLTARNFASAALQNTTLRTNLDWLFGGKQQHGWNLYTPLICHLIETEKGVETSEFASALSQWQNSAGLNPNGILDSETLYQMVATWQSRRIKDRTYPQPDQLFTAPISDFYDPTRPDELRQVELKAYAAYKQMVAAAAADPSLQLAVTSNGELAPTERYLKIISAFRSKEYQEHLRQQSPNAGRAALAVNSPHFTGRALDIYVGGEPVSTADANRAIQTQTRVYQWLVKNAGRFGFQPYYYEPWHWEYCSQ